MKDQVKDQVISMRRSSRPRSSAWRGGVVLLILLVASPVLAGDAPPAAASADGFPQPQPGELFREYCWTNTAGDAGGSLRVGGKFDYGGGPIAWPHDLDLDQALRAEIVLEKLLCHDGTRGLAISVNQHDWLAVPEAPGIPDPPWEYQHHTYPVVPLPLEPLRSGPDNQFRLRVDQEHRWNWPQHLIYGVHLRVYYDAARKPHPSGRLVSPPADSRLGERVELRLEPESPAGSIRRVDFLGHFENVNLEGDGCYRQWHHHFVRGELTGQLGTARAAPWSAAWDTTWVPDQVQPLAVAARISDDTGLTWITPAAGGLTLERPGISVELCKPFQVPQRWVTRIGEKSQRFRIQGDPARAVAAQLVWVSWSPGYLHGILINGRQVFEREGPRYAYCAHRVPLSDLSVLRQGENELATAVTPKYNGKMVHGAEINWPGIMVLIRYRLPLADQP